MSRDKFRFVFQKSIVIQQQTSTPESVPEVTYAPVRKINFAATGGFAGLALGLGSWAYAVIAPEPNFYFAFLLIALTEICAAGAIWHLAHWMIRQKLIVFGFFMVVLLAGDFYCCRYISRPSFVFVVPAVATADGRWILFLYHRGPKTTYTIQVLVQDEVKRERVLSRKDITNADLMTYSFGGAYAEANPANRGSFSAPQWLWGPADFEHERYTASITSRDINVQQELRIERVAGKWLYATQVVNSENNITLLDCADLGFPGEDGKKKPCFPSVTLKGN